MSQTAAALPDLAAKFQEPELRFKLREDLVLSQGRPAPDGSPRWLVHDPLTHRYHELDVIGFALLREAARGVGLEEAAKAASASSAETISGDDAKLFFKQMEAANLTIEQSRGWHSLWSRQQAQKHGLGTWLLHNYLFIRVPLLRPERFLNATLPLAMLLASRVFLTILAMVTVSGLYLVSQQWDEFTRTFLHFLTFEGFGGYLAALVVVKALHELGHAYVAKRFGCRVPTMGLAFMVLTPMLYTDVTDAWRLTSRRERLLIDAGGMLVEIGVAGIATLAWVLLPDGIVRSICFFVATTSWVTSLAVNLSPLMRFDGYYILTDLLDIPNLQQRAFALMRWRIRRTLFGINEARLENFSARREALVFAYGLAVTLYRLVLFTGIAIIVYHATFKMLGILLFCVEIGWFVLKPMFSEVGVWWGMRVTIAREPRSYASGTLALALLALLVVPWSGRIEVPAVMEPAMSYHLTAATAGQITDIAMQPGMQVQAGDVLLRLRSPSLASKLRLNQSRIDLITYRQTRQLVDQADREDTIVLQQKRAALEETRDGILREQADLVVRAPVAGRIVDMAEDLAIGRWMEKGSTLAMLISNDGIKLRGMIGEAAVLRVRKGDKGRFIPEDILLQGADITVASIAAAPLKTLDMPALSSLQGGDVSVRAGPNNTLVPVETQFLVEMQPTEGNSAERPVTRGMVLLDGQAQSFASQIINRALGLVIRESGF